MAEGDAQVHNNFLEQLMLKTIDLVNDTIKVALYDATHTWSKDGANVAYTATNEIVASGYTAGGATLGSKTVTQDDINDRAVFDGANITWTNLAASAPRHAEAYDDTTATKWVLMHWELATDSNGADYTLAFAAAGILLLA